MKQYLFSIHQVTEKFMLRVSEVVVDKRCRAESLSFRKQFFKGLDFLTIKRKSRSGTWGDWVVHSTMLTKLRFGLSRRIGIKRRL